MVAQLTCFGLLHWEKNAQTSQNEQRDREKKQRKTPLWWTGVCVAILHNSSHGMETEKQKELTNTNQETPSMLKGSCKTFRLKPALLCLADVNNTPIQKSLYGNMTFGHSKHHADLIHSSLDLKMWAGSVVFQKSYFKAAFAMMIYHQSLHIFNALNRPERCYPDLTTGKQNRTTNLIP